MMSLIKVVVGGSLSYNNITIGLKVSDVGTCTVWQQVVVDIGVSVQVSLIDVLVANCMKYPSEIIGHVY